MSFLSSPLLFFLIGVFLGLYIGNPKIRKSANNFIDKYAFKKKTDAKSKPKENNNLDD